jgi:hypothetical protein
MRADDLKTWPRGQSREDEIQVQLGIETSLQTKQEQKGRCKNFWEIKARTSNILKYEKFTWPEGGWRCS